MCCSAQIIFFLFTWQHKQESNFNKSKISFCYCLEKSLINCWIKLHYDPYFLPPSITISYCRNPSPPTDNREYVWMEAYEYYNRTEWSSVMESWRNIGEDVLQGKAGLGSHILPTSLASGTRTLWTWDFKNNMNVFGGKIHYAKQVGPLYSISVNVYIWIWLCFCTTVQWA